MAYSILKKKTKNALIDSSRYCQTQVKNVTRQKIMGEKRAINDLGIKQMLEDNGGKKDSHITSVL